MWEISFFCSPMALDQKRQLDAPTEHTENMSILFITRLEKCTTNILNFSTSGNIYFVITTMFESLVNFKV